jgi:hypothetical protein
MPDAVRRESRSSIFILYIQLVELEAAAVTIVENQLEIGQITCAIVKKLEIDLRKCVSGSAVENWPPEFDTTKPDSPSDLLARVALMKGTMSAFLSPEEIQEKKAMGFQTA